MEFRNQRRPEAPRGATIMAAKQGGIKRQDAPEQPNDREKMVREAAGIVIRSHKEALKELERH